MNKLVRPHLEYAIETLNIVTARTPANEADLLGDPILLDAVLMRVQEAGEHLSRIRDMDPEYFTINATDEWNRLIGLRNIISHGYREIDPKIIWDVLSNHLPDFIKKLEALNGKT